MSQTRDQQRFTISEVAADWHEQVVPQRIMYIMYITLWILVGGAEFPTGGGCPPPALRPPLAPALQYNTSRAQSSIISYFRFVVFGVTLRLLVINTSSSGSRDQQTGRLLPVIRYDTIW